MNKFISLLTVFLLVCSLGVSGCKRIKTYEEERARVDQNLQEGNRGYVGGEVPDFDDSDRKLTRKVYTVEVDLPPYYDEERQQLDQKIKEKKAEKADFSEQDLIVDPQEPVIIEKQEPKMEYSPKSEVQEIASEPASFEKYTVAKNDTLQKISQKFYGTTKKWIDIYEFNKDILSAPDKIYPGQTIKIPQL